MPSIASVALYAALFATVVMSSSAVEPDMEDPEFRLFLTKFLRERRLSTADESPVVREIEQAAAASVNKLGSSVALGVNQAARQFGSKHVVGGGLGGRVKISNSLILLSDMRVLTSQAYYTAFTEVVAKQVALADKLTRVQNLISPISREIIVTQKQLFLKTGNPNVLKARLEFLSARQEKVLRLFEGFNSEMAALKFPPKPKFLTAWDTFKTTPAGKVVSAKMESLVGRFRALQNTQAGKWLRNLSARSVSSIPANAPGKTSRGYEAVKKTVNKIFSSGQKMRIMADGRRVMMMKRGFVGQLMDGVPRRVIQAVQNFRSSVVAGYGSGRFIVPELSKTGQRLGKIMWMKGYSKPIADVARGIRAGVSAGKRSAMALASKAGPLAMLAAGGHAIAEATRDLTLLHDQAARGEDLDPQLIRNVIFAFTGADVVLGRGGTEMIGGIVIEGARRTVKHLVGCMNLANSKECGERTVAGLRKAVGAVSRVVAASGKFISKHSNRAWNATRTCMAGKGVFGCSTHAGKQARRGIGKAAKWTARTVGGFVRKHVSHYQKRWEKATQREEECKERMEQCESEDAESKRNKSRVFGKLASASMNYLKAAPSKSWKALKGYFSGDD